jgi:hypothetical protein
MRECQTHLPWNKIEGKRSFVQRPRMLCVYRLLISLVQCTEGAMFMICEFVWSAVSENTFVALRCLVL